MTYVDDLLYLAKRALIMTLHGKISSIWPCSVLEFSDQGLRYLGMELLQEESGFTLGQEAYVSNLVRLYGLDPDSAAGLPCPKEWIQDDDGEAEAENYNDEELNKAQRVTGECLWLAYRTRPDILFATNYMASMTSRRPVKVFQVGLRVLAYLNTTSALKLKVESPTEFTKAEFARAEAAQATAETAQATAETTQATAEATQATAETTQAEQRPHKPQQRSHKPQQRSHKPQQRPHKPQQRPHKPWTWQLANSMRQA